MDLKLDETWTWRSWVDSANEPDCGFPLQNLPLCAFGSGPDTARLGAGIGDLVLDLRACAESGLLENLPDALREACTASTLNPLMELGSPTVRALRRLLMELLRSDAEPARTARLTPCLLPLENVSFRIPVRVGDYTDFYASIHHATNVGRLFRPDQPLLPNYKHIPIGYHGRASSIVVSGAPVQRPNGQTKPPSADAPTFAPTTQLDYEVEIGAYIARGNHLGAPIAIDDAEQHIFGISLLNDWSARDIQSWEYQPLGPFLGKSFATTVSPWVVCWDALAPFRTALATRSEGGPGPLSYLRPSASETPAIDLQVELRLSTAEMRDGDVPAMLLSSANLRDLYWSFAQMVTHHTSNGCNLRPGDLLASGTISGPEEGAQGCLLEITQRGASPISLPTGETRAFLEDGDEVTLSGFCRREGFPTISLGECRGIVTAART